MSNEIVTGAAPIEARTIRKIQIKILPFIFLLYVVAYLDRINIGFAALTMNKELAITSQQFGLIAGIFFLGYFLFEVPSNLLLYKIGARVWIARILITWGVIAMLTGFVHTVNQLYVMRFLLGLAEAGYYPGVVLYLTYWFRQREQAQAIALVLVGIPVTSILGGPVSGLILDHVHWLTMSSWRWLLILEGVPAVVGGVLTYFFLPGCPAEAKFLAPDERDWIVAELAREHEKKLGEHQISLAKTFTHFRVWHLASIQFTFLIGLYSLSFWMPQVVKSLSSHYSNTMVGLLAVLPQLAGLAGMVLISRSSDRHLERRYHAAIPALAGGMGWLLLGTTTSPVVSMLLLSLVAAGVYSIAGPFWSLPSEFLTGYAAASGIALINSIGNLGGFVGPYGIGAIRDRSGSLYSEPDYCVRRTENFFSRNGAKALLIAKFVPGISAVAPPVAGINHLPLARFLIYDGTGALLWIGSFMLLGYLFSNQLEQVIDYTERFGSFAVIGLIALVFAWIGWKYSQRRRFLRSLRIARIMPEQLKAMMDRGDEVFVVDLRHVIDREEEPRTIPGALRLPAEEFEQRADELPRDRELVLFCT